MKWEKEFFETFGANKIWVSPSRENVETILEIHKFIDSILQKQKEEIVRNYIEELEDAFEDTDPHGAISGMIHALKKNLQANHE